MNIEKFIAHIDRLKETIINQDKEIKFYRNMLKQADEKNKEPNSFKEISDLMIKYLNDNHHPHTCVIIDTTSAELFEGVKVNTTYEFVKD